MKHEIVSLNTKKALAEALKKAMKQKPFQKITVSELIRECGVNRKTFYYHFEDIYALLKWTFEEEAIEAVRHFDLLVDYEEALAFIMDYMEKNDYMISCAFDSIGRDGLKRFFYADFREMIDSIIDGAQREIGVTLEAEYRAFLSQFYLEGVAGVLIEWLKERDKWDREAVIHYISSTIRESLIGALLKAAKG